MKLFKNNLSGTVSSAALGLFFSLCCVLANLDYFLGLCGSGFLLLLCTAALGLAIGAVLFAVYTLLGSLSFSLPEDKPRRNDFRRRLTLFLAAFVVLMGWFSLWMLYRFPGCMSPDSEWQLVQARGIYPLSNHHPIVHTMIIRLCINLGFLISGNPSVALALYTLVQSAMLSACFAYLIVTMYSLRIRIAVIAAVFLSFILLPYHATLAVTMLKDVWFSGFVLLLCTTLWRLLYSYEAQGRVYKRDLALLFVSSLGMCIFRTNGLYAFFLFVPFVFCFFFRKSKAAALLPVLALVLALLITGPLYNSLVIIPPDTIESLSIPTQHICRAIVEGARLSDEQTELLGRVMDISKVPDIYLGYLSDPVKILVRETGDLEWLAANRGEYLKLWLEIGLENPGAYLRAQIDLTGGYWFPKTDGTVIYPYFSRGDVNTELCLLPAPLAAVLTAIASTMPQLPVIRYFFSNGAAVWLFLALLGLCAARKQYSKLLLFVPVLAVWLTLIIATPLDNEFRYAYSVFTTLPLLLVVPFSHVNNHNDAVISQ